MRLILLTALICIFTVRATCQISTDIVDNIAKVKAVLATKEGPVYYIQHSGQVIFQNKKPYCWLKVFDGERHYNLHKLDVDYVKDNFLVALGNEEILIATDHVNTKYIFNKVSNTLTTMKQMGVVEERIAPWSVIDDKFYYCHTDKKTGKLYLVEYHKGEHTKLFETERYISKIIPHNGSYLFQYRSGIFNNYTYTWGENDLQNSKPNTISGIKYINEHLSKGLDLDYYTMKKGSSLIFAFGDQTDQRFEWTEKNEINVITMENDRVNYQFLMDTLGLTISLQENNEQYYLSFEGIKGYRNTYQLNYKSISSFSSLDFTTCIWMGNNDGLHRLKLDFGQISHVLEDMSIRSIYPMKDKLLVGIAGGYLHILNRRPSYTNKDIVEISLPTSDNRFIETDSRGRLLVGGLAEVYELKSDLSFEVYAAHKSTYTYGLLPDGDILTCKPDGYFINEASQNVLKHQQVLDNIGQAIDILALNESTVAIATVKGIYIYDFRNKRLVDSKEYSSSALCLYYDQTKRLYVGFQNGDLMYYDDPLEGLQLAGERGSIGGAGIATITQVGKHEFWLGLFDGIAIWDTRSDEVIYMDTKLLSNKECNRYSSYYDSMYNKIYIGTIDGLNIIDTEFFKRKRQKARIFFSEMSYYNADSLKIVNDNVLYKDAISVTLPKDYRMLTLSFASQFSGYDPFEEFGEFQFKLNDKEWESIKGSHNLTIPYFEHGTNIVKIRAISNAKYDYENILEIAAYATPLYHETIWFRLSLLLLISFVIVYYIYRTKRENRRLESLVSERTRQLIQDKEVIQKQAEDLKELDIAKNQFLSNISHELRTPLTLLSGPIQILKQEKKKNPRQSELLELMQSNCSLLQSRIEELLELSRFELTKVELTLVEANLHDITQESADLFQELCRQKEIDFVVVDQNTDLLINVDKERLLKIFHNVIGNAIKYTPPSGQVRCSFIVRDHSLDFIVEDTGIGIAESDQVRVFERFYQAKTITKLANPGTGIGLAMVKEYVTLMNGSIELSSQVNKGTRVHVNIPLHILGLANTENSKERDSAVTPSVLFKTAKRKTILVVEDSVEMRNFIAFILTPSYDILEAGDGQIGVDMLRQNMDRIDLIISDIMMPQMDGITFLKTIRKDKSIPKKPFIFLSAKHNLADIELAYQIGVDDYIKKPFTIESLLAKISRLLKNAYQREKQSENSDPAYEEIVHSAFLQDLTHFIELNLNDNTFGLDLIADHLKISKRHLIHLVKKEIGMTPNQYIMEVRLNRARRMYEDQSMVSLEEILETIGFTTGWYLKKKYKERFGEELNI